ncbi:MAG: DUF1492 domain-containing protein [Lachnospiraceae bacterium]|nr:DUF1492 domain-containing protein [Clostridia bacterium]MBR0085659.1 DUF1492 domain-containing protein [Lachnospiraceae bacterium]
MTAKEYLGQYLKIKKRIKKLKGELRELRDLCDQITVDPTTEKVQTSGSKDRLGDVVAKIIDKENELLDQVEEAADVMDDIERSIDMLEDPDEQLMLQMRYVEGMSWNDIISSIPLSDRTAFTKHKSAMDRIEKIINIEISTEIT